MSYEWTEAKNDYLGGTNTCQEEDTQKQKKTKHYKRSVAGWIFHHQNWI
jgi:hypothetical protein